ncbi:VOC family protein [Nocardioides carbamazepini]|uniref:VOC family protein n=1 Tax=Nocardioides carbamazepini TaxID=2854259 RepID=UPI00214A387D|nr:VOC family protein [Nocardioides carbamazepini]MCR1784646.1 VOC family protein [Nocardioides carbamazepini]
MALTLGMITTDSADPVPLATWWAGQFDAEVADPYGGEFLLVRGGTLPIALAFQKVDDPTPGKNRLHLDLGAPDLDAEVERLVAGGATVVARRGDESFAWVTLTDPAGNEFCVAGADEAAAEL